MDIVTVKISGTGWLVNNQWIVPNDPGNKHYQAVQDWLMSNTADPEFTAEEIAAQAAEATLIAEISADLDSAKLDSGILAVINARPAEIETYIDTNVTDIASARNVLKIYGKMLAVLARKTIND